MMDEYPKSTDADILLLLEGTYPFVMGGVSSWVHKLIELLPQYRFAVIFIGGSRKDYGTIRYSLPKNLVHLETHYLFDNQTATHGKPKSTNTPKEAFSHLTTMHEKFTETSNSHSALLAKELHEELLINAGLNLNDFLYSRCSWEYLLENYREKCPEISFLDYFWTIRNMHAPIWQLLDIIRYAPSARILHSVSTGFAGFLGALLYHERKTPFVLTEHGIYVKERRIDLLSQWVAVGTQIEQRQAQTKQYLTNLWIHFFEVLARICYSAANPIISLFGAYQQQQIDAGAPAQNTRIIPNGIPIPPTDFVIKPVPISHAPVIALIGRVVPIKDIKTFIRSMVAVKKHLVTIEAWIVGPTDEDPTYFNECKELVNVLKLTEQVHFKGTQKIADILPSIDLLVLSSISEGLPLVLLEGFAEGIPAVTTDVGACSELIYGKTPEDIALGPSGIVVEIANANALADAIIALMQDPIRCQHAQHAGRERVKRYYSQEQFLQQYTTVYNEALTPWQA